MNLLTETRRFLVWFARLNKVCLKIRPFWTAFVIGATVVSNVAKLLAFLLPLKVVLLAGSSGVPRYFAFFIDVANKDQWILWLAAGAVLSYVTHLGLDALVKRMALTGGASVARFANTLTVLGNQERAAQRYYKRITGLTAEGIFLFMALSIVSLLTPGVMLSLLVLVLVILAITVLWLLQGSDYQPTWIENNSKLYVSVVTSTLFLVGFLLLVRPYVVGDGPNLLISIISLVMLKRSAKAIANVINESISLTSDAEEINPLMFRGGKVVAKELPARTAIRDLFQKEQRLLQAKTYLPEALQNQDVDSQWEDPSVRGLHSLKIIVESGDSEPRYFRQHLYSSRNQHLLEREQFLFSQLDREQMLAPRNYGTFPVEGFLCSLVDYETSVKPTLYEWRKKMLGVYTHYWCIEPPKQLVKDYRQTHRLLHRRIDQDMLSKLKIAVENDDDRAALDWMIEQLPNIQQRIEAMPLYVANQDMRSANVVRADNPVGIKILTWGRWSIEPLGFKVPRNYILSDLEAAVETVSQVRDIPSVEETVADIVYVNTISHIEASVNAFDYCEALGLIKKLSRN